MNTQIFDYFKKLSQKEFFWINLINCVLGMIIIVLGVIGLVESLTIALYGFMFAAGSIMLLLNFYKGRKMKTRNTWLFLIAGIAFGILAVLFFVAMMR